MSNKTAKCHECGSRFTIVARFRFDKKIYLCRTCAYQSVSHEDEILGNKKPLIMPFIKRRLWYSDDVNALV